MTAETITDESARTYTRRCACGAYIKEVGYSAYRSFILAAHRDCEVTAILDDSDRVITGRAGLVAMRGARAVAYAAEWSTGWAVYMGGQSGTDIVRAEVTDRTQAEAVLKLIVNAYDKGASR
ncbi:hypothetical protein [Mycobacteroides franklinii]|uniref:hypothetical protein n=1 Tax=Mycobacteroides franklinii TaxID=948102 RepID=UPI000991FB9E|nr:hypothetical protein [Mycobacteroides franklinii]ORA64092.1 hypothetical protein BST24_02675 [Mycobacteroides franklinii]